MRRETEEWLRIAYEEHRSATHNLVDLRNAVRGLGSDLDLQPRIGKRILEEVEPIWREMVEDSP